MHSSQKSASDRTDLGNDFSSLNIASSSTIVLVLPANNVKSENNEGKFVSPTKDYKFSFICVSFDALIKCFVLVWCYEQV